MIHIYGWRTRLAPPLRDTLSVAMSIATCYGLVRQGEHVSSSRLIVKVFPVFLLPAFYLGAAACDLYLQEMQAQEEEAAGEAAPSKWTVWKREWAGVIGEIKLLLWICIQFEPYQSSEVHTWSLLFGSVLYLFAVAASCSSPHAYGVGLRWLLGSEWVVFVG